MDQHFAFYAAQDNEETAAMWSAIWRLLQDLANLTKSHSLEVPAIVIPDSIQLDAERWVTQYRLLGSTSPTT